MHHVTLTVQCPGHPLVSKVLVVVRMFLPPNCFGFDPVFVCLTDIGPDLSGVKVCKRKGHTADNVIVVPILLLLLIHKFFKLFCPVMSQ